MMDLLHVLGGSEVDNEVGFRENEDERPTTYSSMKDREKVHQDDSREISSF
jgi:hypothetical protein